MDNININTFLLFDIHCILTHTLYLHVMFIYMCNGHAEKKKKFY